MTSQTGRLAPGAVTAASAYTPRERKLILKINEALERLDDAKARRGRRGFADGAECVVDPADVRRAELEALRRVDAYGVEEFAADGEVVVFLEGKGADFLIIDRGGDPFNL